jgi:hypothetical protein
MELRIHSGVGYDQHLFEEESWVEAVILYVCPGSGCLCFRSRTWNSSNRSDIRLFGDTRCLDYSNGECHFAGSLSG